MVTVFFAPLGNSLVVSSQNLGPHWIAWSCHLKSMGRLLPGWVNKLNTENGHRINGHRSRIDLKLRNENPVLRTVLSVKNWNLFGDLGFHLVFNRTDRIHRNATHWPKKTSKPIKTHIVLDPKKKERTGIGPPCCSIATAAPPPREDNLAATGVSLLESWSHPRPAVNDAASAGSAGALAAQRLICFLPLCLPCLLGMHLLLFTYLLYHPVGIIFWWIL